MYCNLLCRHQQKCDSGSNERTKASKVTLRMQPEIEGCSTSVITWHTSWDTSSFPDACYMPGLQYFFFFFICTVVCKLAGNSTLNCTWMTPASIWALQNLHLLLFLCVCAGRVVVWVYPFIFFFFCQNRSKRKTYETYGTWTLFNIAQMRAETRREAASVCTHRNRNALNLSGNHMNIVFSFLFWGGLGVTGCWSAYFAQYSNHAVITSWNEHCVISASTGNHREHILTGIAARSRCWAKWMHWQWHVNYTSEI